MRDGKSPRALLVMAALGLGGALLFLGVRTWRENLGLRRDLYRKVETLLAEGRSADALALIEQRHRSVRQQSEKARQLWLGLEAIALAHTGNGPRLALMHRREPHLFERQEAAALELCRFWLSRGALDDFATLRGAWRGRETSVAAWFEVDVDALLARGDRDQALRHLQGRSFPGPEDSGRLLRLALLHLPADPAAAAHYLDQAVTANPRNAEVHLHRARLLEAAGQRGPAQLEYQAAFQANTNNPYFRHQLAEFFRRNGEFDRAVDLWLTGLTHATATDQMWLRAWFWSRVARPRPFHWGQREPPPGPLQPLLFMLNRLPSGVFWDETASARLPAPHAGDWVQETFWLRLLWALQNGQEDTAMELLRTNRFRAESYDLDLESALLRLLHHRRTGSVSFPEAVDIPLHPAPPGTRHQFFEALDEATRRPGARPPDALERLLRGPHAFAATFLAAGWAEAALRLAHPDIVPEDYPDWVAFGFARAYALNRSPEAGLAYAARQRPHPALDLLSAELLLGLGRYGDGILKLLPLARQDSDLGAQAAGAIAQTYLRLRQFEEARAAVEENPRLKSGVRGQELLARVALEQGDKATARRIYTELESVSDEAKEYLAQEAFADRKWERARALTEELLRKYPDQARHRARLEAILAAQSRR